MSVTPATTNATPPVTTTTALQPASSPVPLQPVFFGCTELDPSIEDSFNLKPFKELMDEQAQAEMTYYVVASKDSLDNIHFFDGFALTHYYYSFGNAESPLTRELLTHAVVYKIEPSGTRLEAFCNFFDLSEDYDHYLKFLLAANLNLESGLRGASRVYVGGYYQYIRTEPDHLKQAEFWYKKAAEDGYFAAHLAFGEMYEAGIYYSKSLDDALVQYKKALSLIPQDEHQEVAKQIEAKILQLTAQLSKYNSSQK